MIGEGFERHRQAVLDSTHARLILITRNGHVLPASTGEGFITSLMHLPEEAILLGRWQGDPVAVVIIEPDERAVSGRAWLSQLTDQQFALLAAALQVVHWRRDHCFCGRCGAPMRPHPLEYAMQCMRCSMSSYPRQSPCIITLVTHGETMLLAHNASFPPGRFSTLAGFIEPGESAEEALHREVMEEVGIEVSALRFFKSQSWPFPHSFMLGFFAEARQTQLAVDGVEITEAGWFTPDDLPDLPPQGAISRALIDVHVASLR